LKKYALLIACSVTLAACAQQQQDYWQKPGASVDEFGSDRELCMERARQPSSHAYVNQSDGADLFGACMTARGWHLVSVTDAKAYSNALSAVNAAQLQLCTRADLLPIFAKKMPCQAKQATAEQLSDRAKISKAEKPAFMKWRILTEENIQKAAATHQQYNRQTGDNVASLIKKNEEASTKFAEQLYDGRISWGEYNKGRMELGLRTEQEGKNPTL
jgi:hypothetical protein